MNTQSAYDRWSSTYDRDRNLTRDLDHAVTRAVLAQLHPTSILEIGCGTGKNTALLATLGVPVTAIDFSAGMLVEARKKVTSDHVTFLTADLTQPWPCASQSFDLVVCNLVLEHIRDLGFIFAEAQRCLMRGGTFFVCELHSFRQYRGAQARFQHDDSPTEIAAFVHHLSDFVDAAGVHGLVLDRFQEWWHEEDQGQPPRLASFLFRKTMPHPDVTQNEVHTMPLDRSLSIPLLTFVVRDYDEAIAFFTGALRFALVEDTPLGDGKRWVVVAPPGSQGASLLLGKAVTPEQLAHVGNQTGGRVFLFLHTDDFWEDYHHMQAHGVRFAEEPREEPYGRVVVFFDLYGNKWDLIERAPPQ